MHWNSSLYQTKVGEHREKNVIWISFPYQKELIDLLKEHTTARWSASQKSWYVPNNRHYRTLFSITEEPLVGKMVFSKIKAVNRPAFERFQEHLKLKGYSRNTLRTYAVEFAQLLYVLKDFSVDELSEERLRAYFLYCFEDLKLSEAEINSRINAIKFYFEQVLHRKKMFFDIPRPKKKKQLPKSLNKKQILKIFEVTTNLKHRCMLQLCYGMGLRVSEIVNLKLEDICSETMRVRIENAKGKKDRMVPLPESILPELRAYYREYKPKKYLFEGQYGGVYSVRSVQSVFKTAMRKAGINKTVGIHGLRHSYATHLLEMGTDIRYIQEFLGHNNIKTTQIYTQVTSEHQRTIRSPLDSLK
ncbi:tyrosine-type recombinase/integrase [Riemerella anatipestifer]|uniref:tyrosine-type recombinase/integrase n=1 Tax=Riemerella anatipestifer TaxID=34085 RepID=UPI00069AD310|nr:tyrosine-type recombinase/integrase [Riemerella anatipestifer]